MSNYQTATQPTPHPLHTTTRPIGFDFCLGGCPDPDDNAYRLSHDIPFGDEESDDE